MKDEEIILKFLNNEMSTLEKQAFQQRIIADPELSESVEHSRRIGNIVDDDTIDFSKKVRSVVEKKRKKQSFNSMLVAASASIILVTSVYLLFFKTLSVEERVLSYLEPYPDLVTSREGSSSLDLTFYNMADYKSAIVSLERSFQKDRNELVGLYLGVSYLMNGESEKALSIFESVPYKNTIYKADFIWYRSLALIKLHRHALAQKELENLIESSQFYSDRASKLLEDLE